MFILSYTHIYLVFVLICTCLVILIFIFNKLQAPLWGHTKIPGGECHINRNWDSKFTYQFMWGLVGDRLGTYVDVQVSQHYTTVHVQRLFPPKWGGRWLWHHIMTWLLYCLHKWTRGIKEKPTQAWGGGSSFILWILVQVQERRQPNFWPGYLSASQGAGV